MGLLGELLGPGALAALASAVACGGVFLAGVRDAPDSKRKTHAVPTPTGGGLAIALATACGVGVLASVVYPAWAQDLTSDSILRMAWALAIAFAFFLVGVSDDLAPLGPRAKFLVFVGLAFAATALVGRIESLPLGAGVAIPLGAVAGALGCALWMFTIVNTVNFMDGANGLAMGSAGIGLVGLGAIGLALGAPHAAALAFACAGAIVGFLVWNFPSGRIFAGDSGALFVGGMVGTTALLTIHETGMSPFLAPILFFPLLADVLLTLDWRRKAKRRLLEGHRDHLYQIGLRAGLSHWKVTLIYWGAAVQCGLLAFVLALVGRAPDPGVLMRISEGAGALDRALLISAGIVASLATLIAFAGLAFTSVRISAAVRRFAAARGHDGD